MAPWWPTPSPGRASTCCPTARPPRWRQWLKARPGAEVICRTGPARICNLRRFSGAGLAVQVADRLAPVAQPGRVRGEGRRRAPRLSSRAHCDAEDQQSSTSGQAPAAPPPEPDGLRDVCGRERALVSRTLERHAAVRELLHAGRTRRETAGILGLDRRHRQAVRPPRPTRHGCWSRPPAGPASWTRSSPGSTAAQTRPSPIPPRCTPRSPGPGLDRQRAGRRALRPPVPRRRRPQQGRQGNPRQAPAAAAPPKTRQVTRWLLTQSGPPRPRQPGTARRRQGAVPSLDAIRRQRPLPSPRS